MDETADELESIENNLREQIDDYHTTLSVIIVFGQAMCWDKETNAKLPDSRFWFGRKMDTSAKNEVSPNSSVTPDVVLKLDNESGIVAEVKNGFPNNDEHFIKSLKKALRQIKKYDDELVGWDEKLTEADSNINHDLVLLVPNRLRVQVEDRLKSDIFEGYLEYSRKFAIISFHRDRRVQEFFNLWKFYGNLSNAKRDDELRRQIQIPINRVLPENQISFHDENPPMPYIMEKVWLHITDYIDQKKLNKLKKEYQILIDEETLIRDMKILNFPDISDPRTPDLPKAKWVRKALSELKNMKYLKKISYGKYKIKYSQYKRMKSPLDTFINKIAKNSVTQKKYKDQLSLF